MPFTHRILLLGGSGPTGQELVRQALEQGHSVTALARRPERLKLQHARLRPFAADLRAAPESLDQVLPEHDMVLSALGRGQSLRAHGLMARATATLVAAMQRHQVRRLVFLSAYGVDGTTPKTPFAFRMMFKLLLADIYADKAIAEANVRASSLDWTILAPVLLTKGPARRDYRMGEHLAIHGLARIARADVADAMLRCLDDTTSLHKRYVVAP